VRFILVFFASRGLAHGHRTASYLRFVLVYFYFAWRGHGDRPRPPQ